MLSRLAHVLWSVHVMSSNMIVLGEDLIISASFLDGSFSYCIFEEYLTQINDGFKYDFQIFTLDPSMEVCFKRALNKMRERPWKEDKIREFYDKGIQNLSQSRAIIDNSELAPPKTAKEILKYLIKIRHL